MILGVGNIVMIIEWEPVKNINNLPPFGDELPVHLEAYRGAVKQASFSAWNLLYKVLSVNNLQISTVDFTDTGKPYFKNSNIHFSISHSGGVCAVAVSGQSVGVDIELQKISYNFHLIERSLTEKEQKLFDGDFTRIWCRKEAVAKMTGKGITGYPNNIDTTDYQFREQKIEFSGKTYWLVAVNCCDHQKV